DRVDRHAIVRFALSVGGWRGQSHLHTLSARGRNIFAAVVRANRHYAMPAIEQHGELNRRRTAALPDRRHRTLHGPSAVYHVVHEHDGAILDIEIVGAIERTQRVGMSVRVERGAGWTNPCLALNQITQPER